MHRVRRTNLKTSNFGVHIFLLIVVTSWKARTFGYLCFLVLFCFWLFFCCFVFLLFLKLYLSFFVLFWFLKIAQWLDCKQRLNPFSFFPSKKVLKLPSPSPPANKVQKEKRTLNITQFSSQVLILLLRGLCHPIEKRQKPQHSPRPQNAV